MLKKVNRINKKAEIDKFFGLSFAKGKGRNFSGDFIIVKILTNKENILPKFAFIVSNKVDKRATARNKIKRRLRFIVSKYLKMIESDKSFILVAKNSAKNADFKSLENDFLKIAAKARLFHN